MEHQYHMSMDLEYL